MDPQLEARITALEAKAEEFSRLATTPGILDAVRLQIVDQNGSRVAVLGSGPNGGFLTLFRSGKPLIHLNAEEQGGLVQVLDRHGESVVGLGTDRFGGLVSVSSAEGCPMAGIGVDGFGGVIQTLDRSGETVGAMRSDDDGGLIEARNKDGEIVASLAVVDDGGLVQIRNHDGGTVGSLNSVSTGGKVSLHDSNSQIVLALGGAESGGRLEFKHPTAQFSNSLCLGESGHFRIEGARKPNQNLEPKPTKLANPKEYASVHTESESRSTADSPTPQAPSDQLPDHDENPRQAAVASTQDSRGTQDLPDIVDVIGVVLELKPKGREFVGKCPFHEDENPTMAVVPLKQVFHCFSCGMGGDAITFVQAYHKLSREEALAVLAIRHSDRPD